MDSGISESHRSSSLEGDSPFTSQDGYHWKIRIFAKAKATNASLMFVNKYNLDCTPFEAVVPIQKEH